MRELALTLLHVVALTLGAASCQASGGSHATLQRGAAHDTVRVTVEFERSGGVAGTRLHLAIDSDTLTSAQAGELRRLIEEAGFFNLPAEIVDTTPQPDRFEYRVSVKSAGQRHAVHVTEAAAPATLRPLLDWLTRAALRARRPG